MPKIIEYPDELTHYGRLGMKWGQHIFGKEQDRRRPTRQEKNAYFEKSKDPLFRSVFYRMTKEGSEYRKKVLTPMYKKSAKHIQKLITKKEPSELLKSIKKEYWNEDVGGDSFKRLVEDLNVYMMKNVPKDNKSYYIPSQRYLPRKKNVAPWEYRKDNTPIMARVTLGQVYTALWERILEEGSRNHWDEVLDFSNPRNVKMLMADVNRLAEYKGG